MKYLGIDKVLSSILIAAIIVSSIIVVYLVITLKSGERSTEFYILDPNGTAKKYPTHLKIGEKGKVIIGIVNHECENVIYRLEVNFNGTLIHKEPVFLIENEKWESPLIITSKRKGESQKLEFLLYKEKQIEIYRELHLWINIT